MEAEAKLLDIEGLRCNICYNIYTKCVICCKQFTSIDCDEDSEVYRHAASGSGFALCKTTACKKRVTCAECGTVRLSSTGQRDQQFCVNKACGNYQDIEHYVKKREAAAGGGGAGSAGSSSSASDPSGSDKLASLHKQIEILTEQLTKGYVKTEEHFKKQKTRDDKVMVHVSKMKAIACE
jgi:hypothetical protein